MHGIHHTCTTTMHTRRTTMPIFQNLYNMYVHTLCACVCSSTLSLCVRNSRAAAQIICSDAEEMLQRQQIK